MLWPCPSRASNRSAHRIAGDPTAGQYFRTASIRLSMQLQVHACLPSHPVSLGLLTLNLVPLFAFRKKRADPDKLQLLAYIDVAMQMVGTCCAHASALIGASSPVSRSAAASMQLHRMDICYVTQSVLAGQIDVLFCCQVEAEMQQVVASFGRRKLANAAKVKQLAAVLQDLHGP